MSPNASSTPTPTETNNDARPEGESRLATSDAPSDSAQRLDEVLSTLSTPRSGSDSNKNVLARVRRSFKTLVQPMPLDNALQESHRALRAYKLAGGVRQLDDSIRALSKAADFVSTEGESLIVRQSLAQCLYLRYEHTNQLEHLDAAIAAQRLTADLAATHLPKNTAILFQLSQLLRYRFRRLERLEDLDDAINALQRVITIDDQARFHVDLGLCLRYRFETLGNVDELKGAITHLQHALSMLPDDDSYKLRCLKELVLCLRSSFGNLGRLDDLNNAIWTSARAVQLAGKLQMGDVNCLLDLSSLLYLRFENTGHLENLDDLNASIGRREQAIEFMDNTRPSMLSQSLNQLCLYLRRRFEFVGDIDDLHSAIAARERAVELIPDVQSDGANFRLSFASLIFLRFEKLGNVEDLDRSIQVCREEIELVQHTRGPKLERVAHLSLQLLRRYERSHALMDLENAIAASRDAVQLALLHRDQFDKGAFHNLLELRSQRTDALTDGDLDATIARCKRNIRHQWSYLDMAEQLSNLALYHYYRFLRQGDMEDLDASISAAQDAIAAEPSESVAHSERLIALGAYLLHRFEHIDDHADVDSAILSSQLALESLYEGHPAQRRGLMTLGFCLQYRFDRLKEMDDIENAVAARHRLIKLTPKTHADWPGVLEQLCLSLESRFVGNRTSGNYHTARRCLETAISQPLGEPSLRLRAAVRYEQLLTGSPELNTADSLLLSYSHIIGALPELSWLVHGTHQGQEETVRIGDLVNRAVSTAIGVGALSQAVEWFDLGRTLFWSHISPLRTPLYDVCGCHSNLARSLADIRTELQIPEFTAGERHGALVGEYERLMSEIHRCTECKNPLRTIKLVGPVSPSTFSLFSGTAVLINMDQSRCDALVLSSAGDVRTVELPGLTRKRARTMRDLWVGHMELCAVRARASTDARSALMPPSRVIFSQVLKRLWIWVVYPILQALDISQTSANSGLLPHVVWCPTGPLTHLPLHAAGVYDGVRPGARVFDLVVSSYIPSLSALLRCCDEVAREHSTPNVLVITQPEIPGRSSLQGGRNEGALLREALPGHAQMLLEHDTATVQSILAVIGRHPWVHLACHGSQNPEDPMRNGFALYDGLLTLGDLMTSATDDTELAFLSACHRVSSDEKISDESTHLAVGMLAVGFKGVVSTSIWSIDIRYEDEVIVVGAYYKLLLETRRSKGLQRGQTGAAYALHGATRRLREEIGEESFERWVPFVHYGA
ncbi:unnamed protein product [Peniophora sp. CBMAI 1063]|nr:unnamed protein product [Peniophora sp. CBMAI 1063]